MAMKKDNPAVSKRIADRKAFVKDKVSSKGINAKQARIKAGSGEKMNKVGSKDAPTAADFKQAAKTAKKVKKVK